MKGHKTSRKVGLHQQRKRKLLFAGICRRAKPLQNVEARGPEVAQACCPHTHEPGKNAGEDSIDSGLGQAQSANRKLEFQKGKEIKQALVHKRFVFVFLVVVVTVIIIIITVTFLVAYVICGVLAVLVQG